MNEPSFQKHLYYLNSQIYDLYSLIIQQNAEINNYSLSKIFEYWSCLQLSKQYQKPFNVYEDIDEDIKLERAMTKHDTGIDFANENLKKIGQAKLRKTRLSWREISTFAAHLGFQYSQNPDVQGLLTYNTGITLHPQLEKYSTINPYYFRALAYDKSEMVSYCEQLIQQSNKFKVNYRRETFAKGYEMRYYQRDCVDFIRKSIQNTENTENTESTEQNGAIVRMPTGSGKSFTMIQSLEEVKRYIIFVPRITLMEQMKQEFVKCLGKRYEKNIQCIGDYHKKTVRSDVKIVICVFNSAVHLETSIEEFDVIYIDEAHLILGIRHMI